MSSYYIGVSSAIVASLAWALSPLLSFRALRQVGPTTFTKLRMVIGGGVLFLFSLLHGSFDHVTIGTFGALALSGAIGVVIGDVSLYASQNMLGVRLAGLLYSSNSAFTIFLGALFLGEIMPFYQLMATLLVIAGVTLAVTQRNTSAGLMDSVTGSLKLGIALGIASAVAQAIGSIVAKPALQTGIDPFTASAIRVNTAALLMFGLSILRGEVRSYRVSIGILWRVTLSAAVSIGLGIPLVLIAIHTIPVGLAAVLSSLAPIFTLPLLHFVWKERINAWCWFGTALSLVGSAWLVWN